jgi:maltose-binding protein MalE
MRISIDATPAVREVLRDELWKELQAQLPADSFRVEADESAEKGVWEDLGIAVLSKIAVEIIGKVIATFTKKHKVKVKIQEADGRKIDVSYSGDDYSKLEVFLTECIK